MKDKVNQTLVLWITFFSCISCTNASDPWNPPVGQDAVLTITPSTRVVSGTRVTLICHGSSWHEGVDFYTYLSVPTNPFTANPSMTGKLTCSFLERVAWIAHNGANYITVVPKTPTLNSTLGKPVIGGMVSLTCDAESWTGSPARSFKFMKNSALIYSGANKTFQFQATSGNYSCIVLAGTVASDPSANVTITTQAPKTPVLHSTLDKPGIGEMVSLTCDAESWTGSPARSFKFMNNSALIHSGASETFQFQATGQTSGDYSCILLAGTVVSDPSAHVTITTQTPGQPVLETSHHMPLIGEVIVLTCKTQIKTAPGTTRYKFMKDSTVIHEGPSTMYSFPATDVLTGNYACAIYDDPLFSIQSPLVLISVFLPATTPPTTRKPIIFTCESGSNAVDFYIYPFDPAQYIHCEAGHAYLETCPTGEQWSQAALKCQASNTVVG